MISSCGHNSPSAASRKAFKYNPFEIAVFGPLGTERAAFAARLAHQFSRSHRVGQVFEKQPGMRSEAAGTVGINMFHGEGQNALMYPSDMDAYLSHELLLDADIVFFETNEDGPSSKIVLMEGSSGPTLSNVICYVGTGDSGALLPSSSVYFHMEDLVRIDACIYEHFQRCVENTPLYGLVLAGGRSTRMKSDKAALSYHGKPQALYCSDLLKTCCDEVFVSIRPEQADDVVQRGTLQIHDRFHGFGPLGGILSALKEQPAAAWLVLACDLPFVDEATIQTLIDGRNPYKLATAFTSHRDGFPEPLCAIYEPKSLYRLLRFLAAGIHCPRKALINSDTHLLALDSDRALSNANSREEYAAALAQIAAQQEAAS